MSELTPKTIIEGMRLTYKTELAFTLNEHPRMVGHRKYHYHSHLISGEWGAFSNQPWGRGLLNFAPEEEALAMENYHTWVRLFELQRYYSWIIDRFHISTRSYQLMNHSKDYDFLWLEQRLKAIGFHLVFLTRTPESFAQEREDRLNISANPKKYDNLQIFIDEQEKMRALLAQSILPTLEVNISGNDIDGAVDKVADWMEATGGLYSKD